jgi:hypothetical protein
VVNTTELSQVAEIAQRFFFGSMPGSTVGKCTMTKVGKSDGKGTFARTRGNDKVVPRAAVPSAVSRGSTCSNPGSPDRGGRKTGSE